MDPNGLRGAALATAGLAAMLAAEMTGSKKAARVEEWVDGKFAEEEEK